MCSVVASQNDGASREEENSEKDREAWVVTEEFCFYPRRDPKPKDSMPLVRREQT